MGIANDHSIAWGIARALAAQGAELAFTYQGDALGKRVKPPASQLRRRYRDSLDVEDLASVDALFDAAPIGVISNSWSTPSALPTRMSLKGRYADTSRENYRTMVISCFSFTELARRAAELMPTSGGSMITLTFGGSMRVMPNYNVMGVAKAALEASVRYLAADFGSRGIRVNAISAGPIRTLAGSGIGDARAMFAFQQKHSPLGRGVTLDELGEFGALSAVGTVGRRHRRNPLRQFRLQHHLDAASGRAEDPGD